MSKLLRTIKQIERDFDEKREPFDNIEFPEERLLEEAITSDNEDSMEHRLQLLSAFSMLDYNRDANQLVDNLLEFHKSFDNILFYPGAWANKEEWLSDEMEDIGFRYPNRDAKAFSKNSQIIRDNYHGSWSEFVLDCGTDAPSIVQRLEEDEFLYLKGDKIAPMYTRFIDQYVCDLDNLWELEIPVDTHIHRLTEELRSVEMDKDGVRRFWREIGGEQTIRRHVVDGALWQIGNNWDDWGEEYWEEVQ